MTCIGLIKEGKVPADNRVALTPTQCKWIQKNFKDVKVVVQSAENRCFTDAEYRRAGIEVKPGLESCDILLGIKEVPVKDLIANKTYLFFSHTRKKQVYNRVLLQEILKRNIRLIDYECLEHEDGQRIIGFGFFAGIVGAHNGMMAYGMRTGAFQLDRVYRQRSFKELIHCYFGLKIPNIKIAVTGSGRVAHGVVEVMNLMGVIEVEKEEYLERDFSYPVYVQLKGADLYKNILTQKYNRLDFHENPQNYECLFNQYYPATDVLMNGVYWDSLMPRLFKLEEVSRPDFRIETIADITDDANGSIPINLGDQPMETPIYGVDRKTLKKTAPFLPGSIDIMAVGNLPNELPRDASKYFGEQLLKFVLPNLFTGGSKTIEEATIASEGSLTPKFKYLEDYVKGF